uniref:Uncharacterized protein n=1 Tax=Avena sativa TaxID=4498 RepID=A0ACD5V6B7_AVESA
MAAPPAPVPPATANSAPAPTQPSYKAPPFSQPPSTAGTVKAEIPPASVSTAPAAGVAAAGAATEDSSYIINVPRYSAWFSYDSVSDTERRLMPEFFEGEVAAASGSRGPEAYKYYRDTLVKRFRARPARRLTLTEARRGLIGDVGSVRRVFDFLEEWGLINYGASAPGVKQGRDKREEVAVSQPSLPAGSTMSRKLCIGCRGVCGSAYFTCEKTFLVESPYTNGLSANDLLKEASANAQVQLEKEQKDIEQSLSDIVDVQMKEIQDKINRFEQKELLMERERQQLHHVRELLFIDQLAVVQHQRRPHPVMAENKEEEKPKPVIITS